MAAPRRPARLRNSLSCGRGLWKDAEVLAASVTAAGSFISSYNRFVPLTRSRSGGRKIKGTSFEAVIRSTDGGAGCTYECCS